jgi:hypothetical protein
MDDVEKMALAIVLIILLNLVLLYFSWRACLKERREQHYEKLRNKLRNIINAESKGKRKRRSKCKVCGATTWPEIQPCVDCQMNDIPEVKDGEIILNLRG